MKLIVYSRPFATNADSDPNTRTYSRDVALGWKARGHKVTPDPDAALGPCAKVRVFCTLVHPDGRRWVGENVVRNPQEVCPRAELPRRTGYDRCQTVCDQVGHAEVVALQAAGPDAAGCTAYVENRDYVCRECQSALVAAGVRTFVLGGPP